MDISHLSLDAYFDEWLGLLRTRIQPTTLRSYTDMIDAYLRPVLGECRISELTVQQLDLHFVYLLTRGGRRGGPLAPKTVHYTHTILRQALGEAVRDGRLGDNVAARARPPRLDPDRDPDPRVLHAWDATQTARFLQLTANDPLGPLWHVALATGMRRGELLGLRWTDVDLDTPQLRVTTSLIHTGGRPQLKTTKTGRNRMLALDQDTAAIIGRQPRPTDTDYPLVFLQPDGRPWKPETITDRWRRQWPRLELPKLRLHDLRHCHACLLLDQGVPIKVVAERLGHARTSTTMEIYTHVFPAQDREAADAIERALRGQRGQRGPGPHRPT